MDESECETTQYIFYVLATVTLGCYISIFCKEICRVVSGTRRRSRSHASTSELREPLLESAEPVLIVVETQPGEQTIVV